MRILGRIAAHISTVASIALQEAQRLTKEIDLFIGGGLFTFDLVERITYFLEIFQNFLQFATDLFDLLHGAADGAGWFGVLGFWMRMRMAMAFSRPRLFRARAAFALLPTIAAMLPAATFAFETRTPASVASTTFPPAFTLRLLLRRLRLLFCRSGRFPFRCRLCLIFNLLFRIHFS